MDNQTIPFGDLTADNVILRIQDGAYESHHWIANLLHSMSGSAIPPDFYADVERRVSALKSILADIAAQSEVTLYRGLQTELDPSRPIGEHWTDDREVASRFGSHVYRCSVSSSDIDWAITISRRMVWPHEKEIVLLSSPGPNFLFKC